MPTNPARTTQGDSLFVIRGREGGFPPEDEPERHVATITVELEVVGRASRKEDDLYCVAERAVHAAALAYNFWSTRIVAVSLRSIEPEADPDV